MGRKTYSPASLSRVGYLNVQAIQLMGELGIKAENIVPRERRIIAPLLYRIHGERIRDKIRTRSDEGIGKLARAAGVTGTSLDDVYVDNTAARAKLSQLHLGEGIVLEVAVAGIVAVMTDQILAYQRSTS